MFALKQISQIKKYRHRKRNTTESFFNDTTVGHQTFVPSFFRIRGRVGRGGGYVNKQLTRTIFILLDYRVLRVIDV